MRLICGFYHFDGRPAERTRLDAMVAAMIEPGLTPQIACLVEGPLAMAVLDFARNEPFEMVRGASGLIVAGDCRFDEPEQLAQMLGVHNGDRLLPTLLERRGEEGLQDLLGDFAFAAWSPHDRTLLCARDPMGVRPLFVTKQYHPDFAFASLPRALHAGGFASRRLDETQFVCELLNTSPEPERTLFEDVARVAPGQWLQVSAQGVRKQTFWKLEPELAGSKRCTPQQAAEELRAVLERAVRCRLPAQGPVAAHLSGGLDSSALAVLAARMVRSSGRRLQAYSFLSSHPDAEDERPYVESVLRQEPDIDWMPLTVEDWESFFLPRMDCDQLFPVDAYNPDIRVCADAGKRGAQMLLSGWGGDEGATFNGRGALSEALLHGHWRYLAGEFRALRRVRGQSPLGVVKGEILRYLLPAGFRQGVLRALGKNLPLAFEVSSLLQGRFSGEVHRNFSIGPHAARNRHRMLTSPHLPLRAEQWALMGARHGVAVGFPMLDRRVVELAVSLPSDVFQRDGWRRRVFRDAMASVLPDEIRLRHGKITPMEEMNAMFAAQRARMREALMELRTQPQVVRIFDLERALNVLESDFGDAGALALKRVLQAAEFLRQHG